MRRREEKKGSESLPKASQILLNASPKLPQNLRTASQRLPKAFQSIPKASQSLPRSPRLKCLLPFKIPLCRFLRGCPTAVRQILRGSPSDARQMPVRSSVQSLPPDPLTH